LLVTHDVDEALLLADRAVVLDEGRIVAQVRIEATRPRDPTSARFVMQRRELLSMLGVGLTTPSVRDRETRERVVFSMEHL
jgi:sulfonate transport system ATP-binding protein